MAVRGVPAKDVDRATGARVQIPPTPPRATAFELPRQYVTLYIRQWGCGRGCNQRKTADGCRKICRTRLSRAICQKAIKDKNGNG